MREKILAIADQIIDGRNIAREQAELLAGLGDDCLEYLFEGATRLREHFIGKRVRCCSIVSAKTGMCSEDCAFCSQSAHFKTHVGGRTTLTPEQVWQAATEAADNGAEAFGIVNSGYGPGDAEVEYWGPTLQRIRESGRLRTCASLGVVSDQQARRLAEFGVQRYNHNLQTSRRHFPNIIKTHTYDDRLEALHSLKAAGISLCSGGLFGMGETWDDRLDLAFELQALDVEVVPLNFLIAIDGTPLQGSVPLAAMECLKIIAVYRFCLPNQEIKVAGGRESSLGDQQHLIFRAGADSFLIGNYLTTCGRAPEQDRKMVEDAGLQLSPRPGRTCAGQPFAKDTPSSAFGGLRLPVLPSTH